MQKADPFGQRRTGAATTVCGEPTTADLMRAIWALQRQVDALPGAIAAATSAHLPALAPTDRRLLAPVLRAIIGPPGTRGVEFTSREAAAHLTRHAPDVLAAVLKLPGVIGHDPVLTLAKYLGRCAGHSTEGLSLQRSGQHRGSKIWRASAV